MAVVGLWDYGTMGLWDFETLRFFLFSHRPIFPFSHRPIIPSFHLHSTDFQHINHSITPYYYNSLKISVLKNSIFHLLQRAHYQRINLAYQEKLWAAKFGRPAVIAYLCNSEKSNFSD